MISRAFAGKKGARAQPAGRHAFLADDQIGDVFCAVVLLFGDWRGMPDTKQFTTTRQQRFVNHPPILYIYQLVERYTSPPRQDLHTPAADLLLPVPAVVVQDLL